MGIKGSGPGAPGVLLPLPLICPRSTEIKDVCAFNVGSGDLNSRLACTASTLPQSLFFKKLILQKEKKLCKLARHYVLIH